MLFRTCDKCGSNLDPNEICTDCKKNEAALREQEQLHKSKTTNPSLSASEKSVKEGGAADV